MEEEELQVEEEQDIVGCPLRLHHLLEAGKELLLRSVHINLMWHDNVKRRCMCKRKSCVWKRRTSP